MSAPDHDRDSDAAKRATRELASLTQRTEAARTELAGLRQEVQDASQQLTDTQAAHLVEANQQLIFANLRTRQDAEATAEALRTVPRPAELDALTGLPNNILMLDRIAQACDAAAGNQSRLALLLLNLSDFTQINESLGHSIGDQVLQLVASRLGAAVAPTCTVSRYGGDEFLVLLADISDGYEAACVAAKLIAAVGVPCNVGGQWLRLRARIGISIYPEHGGDAEILIDRADGAVRRAKQHVLSNIAVHGDMLNDEAVGAARPSPDREDVATRRRSEAAEQERRHQALQEANEHLVLAALDAQRLLRAAQQSQQRQTALLAQVAHELRNPLAPIRTAAAMLGRIRSEEPLLSRVKSILERQVVHMSRLVSDLLDLSRMHTGKLRLQREVLNLAEVIETSIEACQPLIDLRRQSFTLNMTGSDALEVDGDPVRLTQVLTNLLDNASKYTPEGGSIRLDVTATRDKISLTLTDSGIGISAESLPTVFDPFVQDVNAVGFSHLGLGIGLTVVRELVEAHGGTVSAASEGRGCGSRFTVTLPRFRTS